jgi:two-component system alkaline phosphatase synthesis response regulator PhoP
MVRVLVIDDERAIVDVVRTILEWNGYEVLSADDGSRGFAAAQRQSPDAIILDLMMPVMDGFAVLEALRDHERTAGVPVLVLTAVKNEEVEVRCAELGADGYLRKPFEPDELLAAVRAITAT